MNPSFITNPEYRDYVSEKEKSKGRGKKIRNYQDDNQRKTIFFNYYDTLVKNSHLYPREKTNFIKPYTPPKKPSTSQLLKGIDYKYSGIPNKLQPTWE